MKFKTGIGQDSHRFLSPDSSKPCVIAGRIFREVPGFHANSDGDVVYHAICNAITSITNVLILGGIADELCLNEGITDSAVYVKKAVESLEDDKISHVAISLEGLKPKFKEHLLEMRQNVADVLEIDVSQVGITATTGESLTNVGCGEGVSCICVINTHRGGSALPS